MPNGRAIINFALNKNVIASSEYNENYPAENAVDGNPDTAWAALKPTEPKPFRIN